jgi:ADP-heptose:LPS heptosyltransferase
MHIASAFRRPQVSLFGPTNPFEWRPRHPHSLVICAARPSLPTQNFSAEAAAASMSEIPSGTVCEAVDALLAERA